jgi:tetratricopeptide (TPR) repeat protein
MGERLAVLNEELERDAGVVLAARTGVNTGEVVVGDGRLGGATITGRAVNIAKRLEQAARPGEVLVGEQTWEHVRARVRGEQLEPLTVKGARGPVAAWRLLEVLPDAPAEHVAEASFVGRAHERERLLRAFETAVAERSCRLVTVLGQPGIGKSRLVREVTAVLGDRAVTVLGRCLPYGEGITYWPLVEILRQLFGEDVRAATGRLLAADELGEVAAERIAAAVGIGEAAGASEETHWAVRRLLEALAAERPLIVVLEDIHWAEPTFLDLIEYLAGFASGPTLLLCAARPDLLEVRPEWAVARGGAELVQLEPLSAVDADELVERRLAGRSLPARTRERIVEAAEGNPLFVDQMVALAAEDPEHGDAFRVPPTINALLASRIDRLPEAERRLLERGSVEGRVFHRRALAELLPPDERHELAGGLMALVRRELITPYRSDYPGDDAFRFGHVLIRDAAYASLSKERRAELHLGFAAWLERVASDRALEHEEIGGYHLEQAYLYREELGLGGEAERRELGGRAATRLEAAGHRAAERGDLPAACNLLQRAVSTLAENDRARAALLPDLGTVLVEAGRLEDAAQVLQEASDSGDELVWAHARIQQLVLNLYAEPAHAMAEFESDRESIRQRFDRASDELGLSRLWRLEGMMRWLGGRSAEAIADWELASEHARRAGGTRELVDLLVWCASAYLWGPTPTTDAIRRCAEIREEVRLDRVAVADVEKRLACLHAMRGDFDEARSSLERSRLAFEELGETIHAAQTEPVAFVARLAGEPAQAEAALRGGLERLEEMGERSSRSTLAALLAETLVAQGRHDEATPFVELAVHDAAAGDLATQIVWRSAGAGILAATGDLAEAERLGREAVELAEQTDWLSVRGDTWLHLASVLDAARSVDEAGEAIRAALELYEQKGNVVAAARARPLLEHRAPS